MTSETGRLSRREALGLLTTGAGIGLAVNWRGTSALAAMVQDRAASSQSGAIIRTILRDLSPGALGNGSILFHEHMSFDSGFFEKMRPANAPRPATPPRDDSRHS